MVSSGEPQENKEGSLTLLYRTIGADVYSSLFSFFAMSNSFRGLLLLVAVRDGRVVLQVTPRSRSGRGRAEEQNENGGVPAALLYKLEVGQFVHGADCVSRSGTAEGVSKNGKQMPKSKRGSKRRESVTRFFPHKAGLKENVPVFVLSFGPPTSPRYVKASRRSKLSNRVLSFGDAGMMVT